MSEQKLVQRMLYYPEGERPFEGRKELTGILTFHVDFDCTDGEPALPLKDFGKVYHTGWDIPTPWAIDANGQAWRGGSHGDPLEKIDVYRVVGLAESAGDRLELAKKLGLEIVESVCPFCGGTGKGKRVKGL